jgi:hypothetical protein
LARTKATADAAFTIAARVKVTSVGARSRFGGSRALGTLVVVRWRGVLWRGVLSAHEEKVHASRLLAAVAMSCAAMAALAAACGGNIASSGGRAPDAAAADGTAGDAPSDQGDGAADAPTLQFDAPQPPLDAPPGDAGEVGCLDSIPPTFPDAAALALPADASIAGVELAAAPDGATLHAAGVTSDGMAIYDVGDGVERAAPLDGGPAQVIITPDADAGALVATSVLDHDVVSWAASGQSYMWRAGSTAFRGPAWRGTPFPQFARIGAATADGSRVVAMMADGIYSCPFAGIDIVAQTSAMLGTLGTYECVGLPSTPFTVAFTGSTALVDQLGIASYSGSSWTASTLVANGGSFVPAFAVAPSGPTFLAAAGGNLQLYSVAGGPPTPLDTNVDLGVFTPDGTNVLYLGTLAGSGYVLWRIPAANLQDKTALACSFIGIASVSPDGAWADAIDPMDHHWLVSTTSGAARALAGTAVFTADSTHILVMHPVGSSGAEDVWAQPVAGGALTHVYTGSAPASLAAGRVLFAQGNALYVWDSSGASAPGVVTALPLGTYVGVSPSFDIAVYASATALYAVGLP